MHVLSEEKSNSSCFQYIALASGVPGTERVGKARCRVKEQRRGEPSKCFWNRPSTIPPILAPFYPHLKGT